MATGWEAVDADSGWEPVSEEGWEPAGDPEPIVQRTPGQRLGQNLTDALSRSSLVAPLREAFVNPASMVPEARIRIPDALDALGPIGQAIRGGVGAAGLASRFVSPKLAPSIVKDERDRRKAFEEQSTVDPFYDAPGGVVGKTIAGASTLAGQLVGASTDPLNFAPTGSSVLRRLGLASITSGASDVGTQQADVRAKVQDKYDPVQTAAAMALGPLPQAGIEGAMAGARAARGALRNLDGFGSAIDRLSGYEALPKARREAHSFADVRDRLIHRESRGNQNAVSPRGAFGVAQLMPGTAEQVANGLGRPELAELAKTDPKVNEFLGATYYDQMLDRFGGDHVLASAAYNAGPGRVERWVARFGDPDTIGRREWVNRIPIEETRNYVADVAGDFIDGAGGFAPRGEDGRVQPAPSRESRPLEDQGLIVPEGVETDAQGLIRGSAAPPKPVEVGSKGWEPVKPTAVDDIPIPAKPDAAVIPQIEAPTLVDPIMDRALDILRNGEKVRLDQGKSLVQALVGAGGVRDEGGELSNLDPREIGRLGGMLVRKNKGMTLEDAAVWAQERGYLPERVGDVDTRARPDELLAAIREELAGNKVYAREDLEGAEVAARVQDLDEMLTMMDIDPRTMTNDEIRARINEFWTEPDSRQEPLADFGDLVFALKSGNFQTTKGGLRGQRKAGAVAAPDPANLERPAASVAELAQRLKEVLDLPHRQGRIRSRGALGTYDPKSGVVRTQSMQELDVLAHEAGHAMEMTHRYPSMLTALKSFDAKLRALAPAGYADAVHRQEGFAEFIRWYMTNPDYARKAAGTFYDAFEEALAKDAPKVLAQLRGIQAAYSSWLASPSAAAAMSMVVRPPQTSQFSHLARLAHQRGPMAAVSEFFAEGYRGIFDRLNPLKRVVERLLEVTEKNTGRRRQLKVTEDPYKLMRSLPGAAGAGHMDLMHGVHPYQSLEAEGPSLADAIATALGNRFMKWDETQLDAFGTYLAARRMIGEWDRYFRGELQQPPDQTSQPFWQQTVADFEQANPSWRDAAEMVYEWTNNLWKKRFEAGLITQDQYEHGLTIQDYVPVMRDMSDRDAPSGARGTNNKGAGGVRRFKGSTRQIINPLNTLMQQAYELNTVIARNDALKALDELAQQAGPGGGAFVERIPNKDLKAINLDALETFRAALDDANLDERDMMELESALEAAFGDDAQLPTKIFRAVDTNEKGEPIAYVWRDGQRQALRLPDGKWGKDMVDAIAGMSQPIRSAFLDLAAVPARILRYGVTSHPQFFLANTLRDQLTAALLTDVGYKPFASQAKGLGSELAQDDLSRIYNRMGGEIGGAQTSAEHAGRAERDLQALRKKGYAVRRFIPTSFRNAATVFSEFTELSETGTRLGIFRNAMRRAKEEGLNDWEAAKAAEFEARDYMDFDRRGGWGAMSAAIRVIPFLNASLQALDKSRRVAGGVMNAKQVVGALFGGPPATPQQQRAFGHAMKLWTAAAAMGVAGLALRAAYQNDPEYQEVADYLRNTHWVFKLPNGDFGAWPKPFDLAFLSNVMERTYEAVALKDASAWARLAEGMEALFVPAHDAPILGLPFQLAGNRDAFGAPIVPEHLRGVEPQDQYSERTSEIAKGLGDFLNVSPAQIDHVLKGIGGSWARDALEATDAVLHPDAPQETRLPDTFVLGRFIRDWTRGSTSSKEFWKLLSDNGGKFAQAEGSVRKAMNDGNVDEAVAKVEKLEPQARAYVMANLLLEGDNKLLHPLIRTPRAVGVISDLMADLQEGNIRGADLQPLQMTPEERTQALTFLSRLSVAEKRNALIDAGIKGWENKERLPSEAYLAEVPAPVRDALRLRMAVEFKDPRLGDAATWAPAWAQYRPILEGDPDKAMLSGVLEAKRTKGRPGAERVLRETTPAR